MSDLLPEKTTFSRLDASSFEIHLNGRKNRLIKLINRNKVTVYLTNYGARMVQCLVPDNSGVFENVILGFDTIEGYLNANELYFGATIGPYANRVANGKFVLDGIEFQLTKNNHSHHLHGGENGFHSCVWNVKEVSKQSVTFTIFSIDGEDGYPGNMSVEVTYTLNDKNELKIDYHAETDKRTIINLTNHTYFNLSGAGSSSVGNHIAMICADSFLPVDNSGIPTSEIKSVSGTPFDFREEKSIGLDWDHDDKQIQKAGGFDHNFILNKTDCKQTELAARIKDPDSGRVLEVDTTEPGLQFYTANALDGSDIGAEELPYLKHSAFCLETQHFPDSPNNPSFPSVVLEPGNSFKSSTIYRFKNSTERIY